MNYPNVKILLKDIIYHNPTPEKLLGLIQESDNSYDTILLFGHNPSLSEFASSLIKDFEFDIPKCGIAAFEFKSESWKEIEQQSGILNYVEYPVKYSDEIGAFENSVVVKISEAVAEVLKNINPDAAAKLLKSIAKHSGKLAEKFTISLKHNKPDKKSCEKVDYEPSTDQ